MSTPKVRVAVIEPEEAHEPLMLPEGGNAEIVLRTDLTPEGMQQLVESDARVVVLDLRHTSSAQIASTMRLLRLAVNKLRLVAVTDPSDDASAQACVASGALAHLGQGQNPLSLLRAVNSAQRGAPCMGETGQRAVRRLRRDDP